MAALSSAACDAAGTASRMPSVVAKIVRMDNSRVLGRDFSCAGPGPGPSVKIIRDGPAGGCDPGRPEKRKNDRFDLPVRGTINWSHQARDAEHGDRPDELD